MVLLFSTVCYFPDNRSHVDTTLRMRSGSITLTCSNVQALRCTLFLQLRFEESDARSSNASADVCYKRFELEHYVVSACAFRLHYR